MGDEWMAVLDAESGKADGVGRQVKLSVNCAQKDVTNNPARETSVLGSNGGDTVVGLEEEDRVSCGSKYDKICGEK